MDILGFVVLAGITVGTHVLRDLDLPPPPPVCKVETVKAPGGGYSFEVIANDNASNCVVK